MRRLPPFAVQHDIENEAEVRGFGRVQHVGVNSMSLRLPGRACGELMNSLQSFAMIVLYEEMPGSTDLRPPGETGEQMRFDEALRQEKICLLRNAVDDAFSAGRERPDPDLIGISSRYMHHDLLPVHDLLAILIDEFLMRRRSVEPGRHKDLYIGIGLRFTNAP